MSLLQSTLASTLQNLLPTLNAAETTLAQAFGDYMKEASAGAVPINVVQIDSDGVPKMAAAMNFTADSTSIEGAEQLHIGILAFWGAMVTTPAMYFAGATAIVPPPYATLITDLAATLDANTSGAVSLADAAAALAADIHPMTTGLGTATLPGPSTIFIT